MIIGFHYVYNVLSILKNFEYGHFCHVNATIDSIYNNNDFKSVYLIYNEFCIWMMIGLRFRSSFLSIH